MQFGENPPDRQLSPPPAMDLFVETLTGTAFEVRVSPFETIQSVKSKIQRMEGIPVSQQHLIWRSKELEDENCLHDYRITDGSTVKLVLAMRGGPINTRRIPIEDPSWREMMDYMEANREEIWEKLPGGRQVTLLVFRDGDQINFFRVVDRGDGTLSPLTETISTSSMRALSEEDAGDASTQERIVENAVTLQKMHALRSKMDALNLKKKPKKVRQPSCHRPSSRASTTTITHNHHHHPVIAVKPKMQGGNISLNKHIRLPPLALSERNPVTKGLETVVAASDETRVDKIAEDGSLPKVLTRRKSEMPKTSSSSSSSSSRPLPAISYAAVEAYRRHSMMQMQPSVSGASESGESDIEQPDPVVTNSVAMPTPAMATASAMKPKAVVVPRMNNRTAAAASAASKRKVLYAGRRLDSLDPTELSHSLAKLDPRITVGRNASGGGGSAVIRGHHLRERVQPSRMGLPSRMELHPMDKTLNARPKTSPEKNGWDESTSDVSLHSSSPETILPSSTAKDLCFDFLNRTVPRMRLRSQGSFVIATTSSSGSSNDREGRRSSRSKDGKNDLDAIETTTTGSQNSDCENGDCRQRSELVSSLISSPEEKQHGILKKYSLAENKSVAQEISMKATELLLRLSTTTSQSDEVSSTGAASKLPPMSLSKKMTAGPIVPRCQVCKKKTGLATSYTCRCGKNFCASHRYAETHDCTFDYKTEGRRLLEQANPLVAAPKLPKI